MYYNTNQYRQRIQRIGTKWMGILITRVLSLKPLYVYNISSSHIREVSANIKQQCSFTVFVVFMKEFLFLVAAFLVVLCDINYIHSRHVHSNLY